MNRSELLAEHQRLLEKFEARAIRLQSENPTWTLAYARGQAVLQLPKAYSNYCDVKNQMVVLGIRPTTGKGW